MSVLANIELKAEIGYEERELLETVKVEWERISESLNGLMAYFERRMMTQADNLTLRMFLNDGVRYRSGLEHAIVCGDGRRACWNFYSFLHSLDAMFSTTGLLKADEEATSLKAIEVSIREDWLDTVTGYV
jgi:hypothetical protein